MRQTRVIKRIAGLATVLGLLILGQVGDAAAQPTPMTFKIYNNSDCCTIYPVISTGNTGLDIWLQAQFQVPQAQLGTRTYGRVVTYRVYINPTTGGLPPHASVTLTVPLYSQRVAGATGLNLDEFIDWWSGGRVALNDSPGAIKADYDNDLLNNKLPAGQPIAGSPLITCVGCKEPLQIFGDKTGNLPSNDPDQLVEYSVGAVATNKIPYVLDVNTVDYDISYVDQAYLPVALEPFANPSIGYVGTVQLVAVFRQAMNNFLTAYPWQTYLDFDGNPFLRIPSAGTIFANLQNPQLTKPGKLVTDMQGLWVYCTTTPSDTSPTCSQINAVAQLFNANYANYLALWTKNGCQGTPPAAAPSLALMLLHVYGWSDFNEAPASAKCSITNLINLTPGYTANNSEAYQAVAFQYKTLQNSTWNGFNQYVRLIHGPFYLNMPNAYAYSIDDDLGNMLVAGRGLIMTVGGPTGLENSAPFQRDKVVHVSFGAPLAGFPTWNQYGICPGISPGATCTPNQNVNPGFLSFDVATVPYPVGVSFTDSANKPYQFTLNSAPPYSNTPTKAPIVGCTPAAWCVNVSARTAYDIISGKPDSTVSAPMPVK
ncbi:MAG TPA: hypothetical protein VNV18_19020 [Stellaceae bacterium]|nr:hypothetical protein [Stellaceae bacterium]